MKKIILMIFLSGSGVLSAQNLLLNGDFDTDVSGWFAFSDIAWVSDDGAPISGNGSMLNTNSFNNNSAFPAISDKFAVLPNHWYLTGVSFKVPSDSPVPWAWYWIYWYDEMDNLIGQSDQVAAEFGVPNDVWEHLTGMIQAPPEATMGELRIYFQTAEPTEPDLPFGLWDDVFVLEETIFTDGFDYPGSR